MREITVTFTLVDEQEERLERIIKAYHRKGWMLEHDAEGLFIGLMQLGQSPEIDRKLDSAEILSQNVMINLP